MSVETKLKKPNNTQLETVGTALQERLLRNWDISNITTGIQRVRVTEIGNITEVYVSPGLFVRLCHLVYGNRTQKPFWVGGFRVLIWKHALKPSVGDRDDRHSTLAKS